MDDVERSRCSEVFLPAKFTGFEVSGFHDIAFQSNMKCYVNICKSLNADVVLSSGTTMVHCTFEKLNGVGSIYDEGQSVCFTRVKALGIDLQVSGGQDVERRVR